MKENTPCLCMQSETLLQKLRKFIQCHLLWKILTWLVLVWTTGLVSSFESLICNCAHSSWLTHTRAAFMQDKVKASHAGKASMPEEPLVLEIGSDTYTADDVLCLLRNLETGAGLAHTVRKTIKTGRLPSRQMQGGNPSNSGCGLAGTVIPARVGATAWGGNCQHWQREGWQMETAGQMSSHLIQQWLWHAQCQTLGYDSLDRQANLHLRWNESKRSIQMQKLIVRPVKKKNRPLKNFSYTGVATHVEVAHTDYSRQTRLTL